MPGVLPNAEGDATEEQSSPGSFDPRYWVPLFSGDTSATRFIILQPDALTALASGSLYRRGDNRTSDQLEWSDGTVESLPPPDDHVNASAIETAINSVIEDLGGPVSPKLNGVCPTDATWSVFSRSTKCDTADDVLTLLQASERVLAAIDGTSPATLMLREWTEIDNRMQFRLFVCDNQVVGISHRCPELNFELSDEQCDQTVETLLRWYDERIHEKVNWARCYVVDVHVRANRCARLVDLCEWRGTDSLLFSWDELEASTWMTVTNRAQLRCRVAESVRPSALLFDALPLELRNTDTMRDLASAARHLVRQQGISDDN